MRKGNLYLELTGSLLAAAAGLAMYNASGLYGAVDAGMLKIGLGVVAASWFVMNFRIALLGK